MRFKYSIYLFFLLVGCTANHTALAPKPMLFSIRKGTISSDIQEVKVNYEGVYYDEYIFEVSIRNNSKDSIFINPGSFRYIAIIDEVRRDAITRYAIDTEQRIEKLEQKKFKLREEKNPYSLADKSVKEIATEGIISGTIGLLLGQDGEELETQRQLDEEDWDEKQYFQLSEVDKQLSFWENSALSPIILPPKENISGKVLFPVSLHAKEVKLELYIEKVVNKFRFKQVIE